MSDEIKITIHDNPTPDAKMLARNLAKRAKLEQHDGAPEEFEADRLKAQGKKD